MNRRKLLSGVCGGVLGFFGGSKLTQAKEKSKDRFLLCVHQNVGSLPKDRAEKFCEKTLEKFKNKRKESTVDFKILVLPQRDYCTWIEIFPLDGQEPGEEIESIIYDVQEYSFPNR